MSDRVSARERAMQREGLFSPDEIARSADVDRLDEARAVLPTGGPGPGVTISRSGETPQPTVGADAHREWMRSATRLDDGREGLSSYRLTAEQRERFERYAEAEGTDLVSYLRQHADALRGGAMSVRSYSAEEIRTMPVGDAQRLRRELVVELRKAQIAGKANRDGARLLLELDARLGAYTDRERAEMAAKFLWGERGAQQRGFGNGNSS